MSNSLLQLLNSAAAAGSGSGSGSSPSASAGPSPARPAHDASTTPTHNHNQPPASPSHTQAQAAGNGALSSASNSLLSLFTNATLSQPRSPSQSQAAPAAQQQPPASSQAQALPSPPRTPAGANLLETLLGSSRASDPAHDPHADSGRPRPAPIGSPAGTGAQSPVSQSVVSPPPPPSTATRTARSGSADLLALLSGGAKASPAPSPQAAPSSNGPAASAAPSQAAPEPSNPPKNGAAPPGHGHGHGAAPPSIAHKPSMPTMFDSFSPFDVLTQPRAASRPPDSPPAALSAAAPVAAAAAAPATNGAGASAGIARAKSPAAVSAGSGAQSSPRADAAPKAGATGRATPPSAQPVPSVAVTPARSQHKLPPKPTGSQPGTPRSVPVLLQGGAPPRAQSQSRSQSHSRNLSGSSSSGLAPTAAASPSPALPSSGAVASPVSRASTAPLPPHPAPASFRVDRSKHAITWLAKLRQAGDLPPAPGPAPARASSAATTVELDLEKPQPAGQGSLHPAKLEVTPVSLLNAGTLVPFQPWQPAIVGAPGPPLQAGAVPSCHFPRIANAGQHCIVYAHSYKGKLRLINVTTGARALLSAHGARGVSRAASAADVVQGIWCMPAGDAESDGWRLIAAVQSAGSSTETFETVHWTIPHDWGFGGPPAYCGAERPSFWTEPARPDTASWAAVCPPEVLYHLDRHPGGATPGAGAGPGRGWATVATRDMQTLAPRWRQPEADAFLGAASCAQLDLTLVASIPRADQAAGITLTAVGGPRAPHRSARVPWPTFAKSGPLSLSHVLLLPDPAHADAVAGGALSAVVLLGFEENTCISILRIFDKGADATGGPSLGFEVLRNLHFDAGAGSDGAEGGHFNIVQYDAASRALFFANSLRASVFATQLVVQHGKVAVGDLHEYPLTEPCTSFTLCALDNAPATAGYRLFALHPAGIHMVHLPPLRTRPAAAEAEAQPSVAPAGPIASGVAAVPERSEDSAQELLKPAVHASKPALHANGSSSASSERATSGYVTAGTPVDASQIKAAVDRAVADSLPQVLRSSMQAEAATVADEVSRVVAAALPDALARAINRADTISRLTSVIQTAISAPVQQAAVSAINQGLQHRLPDAFADLGFRLESHITAEMLQIRKDGIEAQSSAPAEASLAQMTRDMAGMRAEIDALRKANQELEKSLRVSAQAQSVVLKAQNETLELVRQLAASRAQPAAPEAPASRTPAPAPAPPAPAAPAFDVEDAFLTVLSDPNISADTRPLAGLLRDLSSRFASPHAALASVSQPVRLALFFRLTNALWTYAQPSEPEQTIRGLPPSIVTPWLHSVVQHLNKHDPQIAKAYKDASSRLIVQLIEAGTHLSQPGPKHAPGFRGFIESLTHQLASQ